MNPFSDFNLHRSRSKPSPKYLHVQLRFSVMTMSGSCLLSLRRGKPWQTLRVLKNLTCD
jgi:hypothetical protein